MRLPAGTYFIADPCYIIRDEKYDRLLEETNFFGLNLPDRGNIFIDSVTKLPFAVFSTAMGTVVIVTGLVLSMALMLVASLASLLQWLMNTPVQAIPSTWSHLIVLLKSGIMMA